MTLLSNNRNFLKVKKAVPCCPLSLPFLLYPYFLGIIIFKGIKDEFLRDSERDSKGQRVNFFKKGTAKRDSDLKPLSLNEPNSSKGLVKRDKGTAYSQNFARKQ